MKKSPSKLVLGISVSISLAAASSIPKTAFAQLAGKSGLDEVLQRAGEVVDLLTSWAAGIFVIVFIVGGLMYITSAGNPQRTDTAKKTLIAGIVGVIILLFSKVLVQTVATLAK